ncbi:S1 family peptidase [Nocardia anaemiae]|uniref:S1 family peptidase n=1 Tax=Nocardia anaemiae TaxID=263910 RepID=UPI0007C7BFE4|nr:S1 family peptidase [Nocardia anaemiae]
MVAIGRIGIRVLVAAVIVVIAPCGNATAAQMATMGGGSGIVLDGRAVCTLTTVGYDSADRMVGLTAGHCAELGMPVQSETQQAGVIGTVAAVDHDNDFAVIEFDRTKVTPVRQVAQTFISGIGVPPRPGDIVCKNGRTSGFDCGVVWDTHEWWFQSQLCSKPGDSGGPVTLGDRLVGMNIGHIGVVVLGVTVVDAACGTAVVHDPAVAIEIGVILGLLERSGGVGAGFRPL